LQGADIFLENVRLNFGTAFHKAYKYGTKDQQKALKGLSEQYKKAIKQTQGKVLGTLEKQQIFERVVRGLNDITTGRAPQIYQEAEAFAS